MMPCGVTGVNSAVEAMEQAAHQGVDDEHGFEPEPAQDRRGGRLHGDGTNGGGESEHAGLEGREAEAELQQQRQQKGCGADADAEEEAPHNARIEGLDVEQAQIDERGGGGARMTDIKPTADGADDKERRHHLRRQEPLTDGGKTEGEPSEPDARQDEALDVERRHCFLAGVGDEARGQDDAQDAGRNVDPENPAPGGEGGDEAAERGPEYRSEQGRDGEPGERRDELGFGHAAQDDEPAHGHHHGAADALQDAEEDKIGKRVGEAAGGRAQSEDDDGGPEHGPGAEAVGDPAAQGNEHGERQEIRGERELERDRVLAHVACNRR